MANKYYYNGKLVRTSNNEYEYGIARGNAVVACCTTFERATIRLKEEIKYMNSVIASNKRSLSEITNEEEAKELAEIIKRQESLKIQIVHLDRA